MSEYPSGYSASAPGGVRSTALYSGGTGTVRKRYSAGWIASSRNETTIAAPTTAAGNIRFFTAVQWASACSPSAASATSTVISTTSHRAITLKAGTNAQ